MVARVGEKPGLLLFVAEGLGRDARLQPLCLGHTARRAWDCIEMF